MKTGSGAINGDDYGGPITFNNEQFGIVSFGADGFFDVYTNVPAFKTWISETTGIEV